MHRHTSPRSLFVIEFRYSFPEYNDDGVVGSLPNGRHASSYAILESLMSRIIIFFV